MIEIAIVSLAFALSVLYVWRYYAGRRRNAKNSDGVKCSSCDASDKPHCR
jgi:hypothetical protein